MFFHVILLNNATGADIYFVLFVHGKKGKLEIVKRYCNMSVSKVASKEHDMHMWADLTIQIMQPSKTDSFPL